MSKRAIILAGGKGTRLYPYTLVLPKPLMPVGEMPILEIIIKQLISNGFGHITLAVNHMAETIKAFFGDGSKWNIKIDYSLEDKPLSTMAPLRLINDLPDNFLVMNGDVLTDLNYSELYAFHEKNNSIFTISSFNRTQLNDYGVLVVGDNRKLVDFKEKPVTNFEVSMGVYIANKAILDVIPENTFYGFDHLMLDLIKISKPALVKNHDGYWLDIGRPDDYHVAVEKFKSDSNIFIKSN
jgi:NDP-sugar pyrophosphorylase family protein